METRGAERKLATILAADVAGYSRLMAGDDEGTLSTLHAFRGILSEHVERHRGRTFATAGDSLVAEFGSPVEAVRCAVAAQKELHERNAELDDARRMYFRIGINLGDVIVEGDNLYGDGVNVAARLEALAEPGGVNLSGTVHELVHDKLDLNFEDLGEKKVKNIDKPVRVYRLKLDTVAKPPRDARRRLRRPWTIGLGLAVAAVLAIAVLTSQPSDVRITNNTAVPTVAVVPFEGIGGDPKQAEFIAGLMEDLRITLSGETGLRVISRSVAAGTDGAGGRPSARDALYVIEGSVRQSGGRMRITASLISTDSGVHLWGGRYDRNASDLLTVQEEVARKIVASLAVKLSDEESERLTGGESTSVVWAGLGELGRLAERTLSFSLNLFGGQTADAQLVGTPDATTAPTSGREVDGR
ncbi:MAG: adenylate/guanylate cyclase domain-containing protein [Proteobacteria bacterium]|nr:adenylate/guanylate cyclase domain-containing protein [Pseudomonadota bacterium]